MLLMWRVSDSSSTRRFNGFGGKVEDGELPAQAAVRELKVCTVVLSVEFMGRLTEFSSQRKNAVLKHHSTTVEPFFLSAKEGRGRFRLSFIAQRHTVGP